MNFNFNFGKKKPDIKQYAIIGIVLSSIIATLSQCTGISQNNIWDLLDEVQRRYFPGTILNEFVIKDPEKLDRRIHRDVDRAIDDYWTQSGLSKAEVSKPRYSEKPPDGSYAQSVLGGEMRLCAPWVDDCPKE
ncbi:MAG: hypothetical protein EB127_30485 [Alphaproteobacteria bacterium]|nr:hypothetical protein [Alphaproteobacteria bacterium]